MRLLLVEDELEMAMALSAALGRYDMILDHAPTLDHALAALANHVHDGIILDRQLPDGDGLSLIPRVRALKSGIPVIVLTARGAVDERVRGLDMGADDYLAKPFAVEELLARIRALMRRSPDIAPMTARIGKLVFDFDGRQAQVNGQLLDLPRRNCWYWRRWRGGRAAPCSVRPWKNPFMAMMTRSNPTRSTRTSRGCAGSLPTPVPAWRSTASAGSATC